MPARPPDRIGLVPLPGSCPQCGDNDLPGLTTLPQWVEDLPEPATVLTRFDVEVGCCLGCGHRVQGRHEEQTSDALGTAACQVGPRALAIASWLHKACGVPLAKICALFAHLGLKVTPGGLSQATDRMPNVDEVPRSPMRLKAALAARAVVSLDETGWRVGGRAARCGCGRSRPPW